MSKFKSLIETAKAEIPPPPLAEPPPNLVIEPKPEQEKTVSLGIKTSAHNRHYWKTKAAEKGLTLTSIIVAALIKELGDPGDA